MTIISEKNRTTSPVNFSTLPGGFDSPHSSRTGFNLLHRAEKARPEGQEKSGEREALPLDLIYGHLPTNQYRSAERGIGPALNGWSVPVEGLDTSRQDHYYVKIQPFHAGGYEMTIRSINLDDLCKVMDAEKTGVRVRPDEIDSEGVLRSVQRSKQKVRYLIKSIGCDRLLTLTKRQADGEQWTIDEWSKAWAKFQRLVKKAGYGFQYVAVPEKHKSGAYHLHVAMSGYLPINVIRGIWWSCCGGRGQGNVDMAYRSNIPEHKRLSGLARYVSKYITKQVDSSEFNKKRYWSSKHVLPEQRKIVLRSGSFNAALVEAIAMFGLCERRVMDRGYFIPDTTGFDDAVWVDVTSDMYAPPPF